MDTITTAIVGALANLSKVAIKDSYEGLKAALKKKFGSNSDLVDAVNEIEKKPNSEGRKTTLKEEIEYAKANDYPELLQLAQHLLELLKYLPGGQQVITQTVSNVKYAATSATGSATISNVSENK
jgi:hypothetical protein